MQAMFFSSKGEYMMSDALEPGAGKHRHQVGTRCSEAATPPVAALFGVFYDAKIVGGIALALAA